MTLPKRGFYTVGTLFRKGSSTFVQTTTHDIGAEVHGSIFQKRQNTVRGFRSRKGVRGMEEKKVKYEKTLSDGSKCKFVFSIEREQTDGNVEEILKNFAQMSKSAYVNLGNKMRYGTAEQDEIKRLAAK